MARYWDSSPSLFSPMLRRIVLLALNDVFFYLLGGSAWILINGIYAQIPFIILVFDGDYGVVSKITLCVTLSSLFPIFFSISFFEFLLCVPAVSPSKLKADKIIPSSERTISTTTTATTAISATENQICYVDIGIALVLSIGIATSLVLTIWTEWVTSQLVPLMSTVIAGGIVGTTSSILYYPHAATTATILAPEVGSSAATSSVAKRQTSAMLFGTATSNLLLAILAILQQGKLKQQSEDRLGTNIVRNYFTIILILMGLGVIGFVGTLMIRRIKKDNTGCDFIKSNTDDNNSFSEQTSLIETKTRKGYISSILNHHNLQSYSQQKPSRKPLSFREMTYLNSTLNAAQFILNALTFFLPGIVPYSVFDKDDKTNNNTDTLQYLIVFQLAAQTLGVLASSRDSSSSSSGQNYLPGNKNFAVKCQLGLFFLFLWIPLVFLSLSNQKNFGIRIPIALNTLLNFAYGYCNTSWFHLLVCHHQEHHENGDKENTAASITMTNKMIYLKNIDVSATSLVRIMGTWHQIGATLGSAIAFVMVQSTYIVANR